MGSMPKTTSEHHSRFKQLIIQNRVYGEKHNEESIWVRKSVHDIHSPEEMEDCLSEKLIDNKLDVCFWIATEKYIDENGDESFIHTLDFT
tara:strand:+ start:555 stop:824 length:270 start_codon:yes stop_codon:yes gene_type:complete